MEDEINGLLRKRVKSKNAANLFMFLVSIAGVTAVIIDKREVSKTEFAGILIIVTACFVVLYQFLLHFRREVLQVLRKTFFILLAITVFLLLTKVVTGMPGENLILLVPVAIIPVIIRTFYDARLALFILLVTIMMDCLLVPDTFEFILMVSSLSTSGL